MTILTASEAAAHLGYCYGHFKRLAKTPGFPTSVALPLGNGRWRGWYRQQLDEWVQQYPGNRGRGKGEA